MRTPDELPDHDLHSAAFDGDVPDDPLDDDARRARDGAFAAFARLGDELRDVTAPAGLLDELRARALDDLAARPAAGAPSRRGRWLAAAAVAVVVLGGIGIVASATRDHDGGGDAASTALDAAGTFTASSGATGSSAASTRTGTEGATKAAPSAAAAPVRALGTVDSLAALAAAFRAPAAGSPATTGAGTGVPEPASPATSCGTVLATAVLGDRPVVVVAATPAPLVVDARSCALVAPLP